MPCARASALASSKNPVGKALFPLGAAFCTAASCFDVCWCCLVLRVPAAAGGDGADAAAGTGATALGVAGTAASSSFGRFAAD